MGLVVLASFTQGTLCARGARPAHPMHTLQRLPTCRAGCLPRVPTAAVLHALPICRVEATAFVPRYTVFALIYFSEDKAAVLGRVLAGEAARANVDSEYFASILDLPDSSGAAYDLDVWAARGQLGWLEITQPDLPLRMGKDQQLPALYQHIEGNRWSYTYRPSGIRRTY